MIQNRLRVLQMDSDHLLTIDWLPYRLALRFDFSKRIQGQWYQLLSKEWSIGALVRFFSIIPSDVVVSLRNEMAGEDEKLPGGWGGVYVRTKEKQSA